MDHPPTPIPHHEMAPFQTLTGSRARPTHLLGQKFGRCRGRLLEPAVATICKLYPQTKPKRSPRKGLTPQELLIFYPPFPPSKKPSSRLRSQKLGPEDVAGAEGPGAVGEDHQRPRLFGLQKPRVALRGVGPGLLKLIAGNWHQTGIQPNTRVRIQINK